MNAADREAIRTVMSEEKAAWSRVNAKLAAKDAELAELRANYVQLLSAAATLAGYITTVSDYNTSLDGWMVGLRNRVNLVNAITTQALEDTL